MYIGMSLGTLSVSVSLSPLCFVCRTSTAGGNDAFSRIPFHFKDLLREVAWTTAVENDFCPHCQNTFLWKGRRQLQRTARSRWMSLK